MSSLNESNSNKSKLRPKLMCFFIIFIIVISTIIYLYYTFFLKNEQSTDDAYVSGNIVSVSSLVPGSVVSVWYKNNDLVNSGDILVKLDDTDAKIDFNNAKTNLAQSVRKIRQLYIESALDSDKVKQATIAHNQAVQDYRRLQGLTGSGAVSKQQLQHAKNLAESTEAELNISKKELQSNKALLLKSELKKQPEVVSAADAVRKSWIALQRTSILSPVTGYVAERNVNVGETLSVGKPILSIVPLDQVWLNANFKETQLANIKLGQQVVFTTDFYGEGIAYTGTISGINMGTGSAFSLLPAQNASGNWIKIVQRIPVKIEISSEQLKKFPLRIGLSANVKINTNTGLGSTLPTSTRKEPAYTSNALILDMSPVEKIITDIIESNDSYE